MRKCQLTGWTRSDIRLCTAHGHVRIRRRRRAGRARARIHFVQAAARDDAEEVFVDVSVD